MSHKSGTRRPRDARAPLTTKANRTIFEARTQVWRLGIQQPLKSFYANMRWQQDSILKQAPFCMASVLDSVTPPAAELGGESIRVHNEFFGHVNVESVLRFFLSAQS
jgi:hypothetical protein